MSASIDWRELMRLGLAEMRLTPDAFWALTPAEFLLLLGQPRSASILNRQDMNELMNRFPDEEASKEK